MNDTEQRIRELAEKLTGNDIRRIRTWSDKQPGFDIARMVGQVLDLVDQFPALLSLIDQERAKYQKAMRALESLTPSGSEFVNDVQRCVTYVREKQTSLFEAMKRAIKARHEAELALGEAEARASRAEQALKEVERERDEERAAHEEIADVLLPLVGTADGTSVSAARRAAAALAAERERVIEEAAKICDEDAKYALGRATATDATPNEISVWMMSNHTARILADRIRALAPAPSEVTEERKKP